MRGRRESDNISNTSRCRIHLYSLATSIGAINGIVENNVNTGNRDEDGDDNDMVVAMYLDE